MDDLISRQDAIDAIEKAMCEDGFRSSTGLIHKTTAYEIIRHLPSSQPEPKSLLYYGDGYSEGKMVYDSAECPNCGYIYDEGDQVWGEPYCPHCGQALDWYMRGEQDDKLSMAIEALSEPSRQGQRDDLIKRQDVYDLIDNWDEPMISKSAFRCDIEDLQSVYPSDEYIQGWKEGWEKGREAFAEEVWEDERDRLD